MKLIRPDMDGNDTSRRDFLPLSTTTRALYPLLWGKTREEIDEPVDICRRIRLPYVDRAARREREGMRAFHGFPLYRTGNVPDLEDRGRAGTLIEVGVKKKNAEQT